MVEAIIRVSGSEFNSDLIERIKALLNGNVDNFEFKIQVSNKRTKWRTESREEYFERLEKSMKSVHNVEEAIVFTSIEEFELFAENLKSSNAENSI